ncbi:MAG: hypothetical protein FJ267_05475 [Planctomycetes bacterium]|nr:hypothetical protein [Planctomycetota bacterium]
MTVSDQIESTIFVDFGIVPGMKLAENVRPLLIEVLSRSGAMIEELETAEGRIEGKSVALSMILKDATARQILSLVFTSTTGSDVPPEESNDTATSPVQSEREIITATKSYLSSVHRLVDDLQSKSEKATNYLKTAVWHETYAKRIDELSVRGVDSDVLAYAESVSSKLRALGVSLRGVPLEVNRLRNSITYDVQYTPWAAGVSVWGGFGYRPPAYNVQTNQGMIQAQQAEAIANGEMNRMEVWKMLAVERQALRVKLQAKYNVDFEGQ